MTHEPGRPRWPIVVAVVVLVCLVGAVFFPMLGFDFVAIDVGPQVIDNPDVHGLTGENLKRIFTSWSVYSFYPIRSLSFAVDYEIWGLNPTGFKLTNGLVHLANVLLVFWLIQRLFRHRASCAGSLVTWMDVPVAAFAAGIFAVHPAVVEPVVWVAGREELLMTLGALGCIHFHVSARRLADHGGRTRAAVACHAGAAFCCAAACLSNAVAAVIPLLIVTWDLLTLAGPKDRSRNDFPTSEADTPLFAEGKPAQSASDSSGVDKLRRILYATLPLWVISAATIVVKWLGAKRGLVANQVGAFSLERMALVLNTYWLNLQTLVWPTQLAIEYPPVGPQSLLDAEVVLGGTAVAATCAVLWLLRRNRLILFGLAWFCLALGPTSQIMPHHIHRADRFLYLPLVGLVVATAVGLRSLAGVFTRRRPPAGVIVVAGALGLVVLVVMDVLSARQVQVWRSQRDLFEQCVKVNPDAFRAHGGLADQLADAGQFDQAARHYRALARVNPDDPETLEIVALKLASFKDEQVRDYDEAIRLAGRACELSRWENSRYIRGLAMVYAMLADSLANRGDFAAAIRNYRNAVTVDPKFVEALRDLAVLLATCPRQELRDYDLATRLAEQACELTEPADPILVMVLAGIHGQAGRREMAIAATEKAIALAQAAGDVKLADELRARLQLYQNGTPLESVRP